MGLRKKIKKFIYRNRFKDFDLKKENFQNQNILITGANSGIGLELVKKFIDLNNNIFAIFHESSSNLDKIKSDNLTLIKCDLSDLKNIDAIKHELQSNDFNLIINNAANFGGDLQNFDNTDFEAFSKTMNLNALSILKILSVILNGTHKGKKLSKVVNISSEMGSINNNYDGNFYIYRTTKSTLNSITKNLSNDLFRINKTLVFSIHPGSVKSKMNSSGLIDPELCAKNIIKMIIKCDSSYNGKFLDLRTNKEINWWLENAIFEGFYKNRKFT